MGTREIKWDLSPGINAIEAFPVIGDIIATTIAIQLTSVHITEGIGEGGIRTLGTLLGYGALAKRCFRPLSHLTNWLREYGEQSRIANSMHSCGPRA